MAGSEIESTLKQLLMELRSAAVSLRESASLWYRAEPDHPSRLEAEEAVPTGAGSSIYLRQRSNDRNHGYVRYQPGKPWASSPTTPTGKEASR